MIAGAIVGAAKQVKDKLPARGRAHDGGRRGRPRAPRRQDRREGVPGKEKSIGEVALFAHYFRLNLPAGDAFGERSM